MKRFTISIFFALFFFTNIVYTKELSFDDKKCAVKLFSELLDKLHKNTKFTVEDDSYFFGPIPQYNPTTYFYKDAGYIGKIPSLNPKEMEILKPFPKYGFYGELLRLNKKNILTSYPPMFYYVSGGFTTFDGISYNNSDIKIFVILKNKNILSIGYNCMLKVLVHPIELNGRSVFYELGFSKLEYEDMINKDIVNLMDKHLKELSKENSTKNESLKLAYNITFDKAVSEFINTLSQYEKLQEYPFVTKMTKREQIQFAFVCLDNLINNQRRYSLSYEWKISRIATFIDSLNVDEISLKYVPILFRALEIGSTMLTADVMFIDKLDQIVGSNPGYTMSYLEGNNIKKEERISLIEKWKILFEKNKENIIKKREYKRGILKISN